MRITRTRIQRTPDEIVVKAYTAAGRYPAADYFTNDMEDARATAAAMIAPPAQKESAMTSKARTAEVIEKINALSAAHEEVAEADAGFDAGEWSGPAHAEAFEREMREIIEGAGLDEESFLAEVAESDPEAAYYLGLALSKDAQ